ncbi:ubiquitin carboxyl-terminal hydrolase, family 1 [Diaporthe helianthi]|uniref:ubiquitinyl hydrolase 1 n=1 Tax=Diaporthe helianthi TaxID=158607 RepID=A0A2P5I1V1_DIAHE|nr:ubiquitin carboxyl-terminal hydrolase, family 1 [Diaporthe helianthi]
MAPKRSSPSSSDSVQPDQKRVRPQRGAATKASNVIAQAARTESSLEHSLSIPPEDLLRATLAPLRETEQNDWKAWVEIESDPAFFNGLLRDLGVQDIKVTELFSVDDVDYLPQPVLGFVLLCKYAHEDDEDTEEAPKSLWFANQTMANGCATVALLNILMNSPGVQLGDKLTDFKKTTQDLPSFQRGYLLESEASMRTIHNAYARRLELLNADLYISNEYDNCNGVPKGDGTPKVGGGGGGGSKRKNKNQKQPRPKKKKAEDDACHYKAFVPLDGKVWILDGLEWNPVCLGDADADSWIPLAVDGLVKKLDVAGDFASILAICQSPTTSLRRELAVNIKTLSAARAAVPDDAKFEPAEGRFYLETVNEAQLGHYGVSWEMLDETEPDNLKLADAKDPLKLDAVRTLETDQARIQSEYNQEMGLIHQVEESCTGRKKNYMPLANKWVEKLAKLGVLEGLLSESN